MVLAGVAPVLVLSLELRAGRRRAGTVRKEMERMPPVFLFLSVSVPWGIRGVGKRGGPFD